MNSVFSVDDLSDLWRSPAMHRSPSEWEMERLLEELTGPATYSSANDNNAAPPVASQSLRRPENVDDEVVEIQKSEIYHPPPPLTHPQPSDRTPSAAPIDSEEYRALLKSKLDLACRAVAMSRELSTKGGDIPSIAQDPMLAANHFLLGSQASPAAAPSLKRKEEVRTRQTTSGSSKDDSDYDDPEGDTGTNEHTDPADAKRARRMLSNRESAGCSRKRNQAQLNGLETQVGQLRDERSSLLSRHTDVQKKCDEAVVNNRIFRANIETLRAKVKMAEEQVKRVTGWNPMLLGRSNTPSLGGEIGGPVDATGVVAGPLQSNSNQFFHEPQPASIINCAALHCQRLNNGFPASSMIPLAANSQMAMGLVILV